MPFLVSFVADGACYCHETGETARGAPGPSRRVGVGPARGSHDATHLSV